AKAAHTQPVNIDTRTPATDQRTNPYGWFNREQHRAVDRATRVTDIADARGIEVGGAVSVDIDANLDFADELHEVDHGLASAVPAKDERFGSYGIQTLQRADSTVAILVDAAAARRQDDHPAVSTGDLERPALASSVIGIVDRGGRDAFSGQLRGDCPG